MVTGCLLFRKTMRNRLNSAEFKVLPQRRDPAIDTVAHKTCADGLLRQVETPATEAYGNPVREFPGNGAGLRGNAAPPMDIQPEGRPYQGLCILNELVQRSRGTRA